MGCHELGAQRSWHTYGSRTCCFAATQDYTTHRRASHLSLLESFMNLDLTMKTFYQKVHVLSAQCARCGRAKGLGRHTAIGIIQLIFNLVVGKFHLVRPPREMPARGRGQNF
eukprot:4551184-Amphidinium_carterae.2